MALRARALRLESVRLESVRHRGSVREHPVQVSPPGSARPASEPALLVWVSHLLRGLTRADLSIASVCGVRTEQVLWVCWGRPRD